MKIIIKHGKKKREIKHISNMRDVNNIAIYLTKQGIDEIEIKTNVNEKQESLFVLPGEQISLL